MSNFLDGKKTYIGITVMVLGWLHFGNLVSETELSSLVNNLLEAFGVLMAIYGRYKATKVVVV